MPRPILKHITVFIFLLLPIVANSTTINVPDDQSTIQDGINAAVSDDTVLIASGLYSGTGNHSLSISGKTILIMGQFGADSVILDGDSTYNCFNTVNTGTEIKGLTIQNALIGISCSNASPIIDSNKFLNNVNFGIYMAFALTPVLSGNTYIGNGRGIGVYGGGGNTQSIIYNDGGEPYVVLTDIEYSGSGSLTVNPGVEIRFASNTGITFSNSWSPGYLYAVGTPTDTILFTSESGLENDWDGIQFQSPAGADTNTIQYCIFEKGGQSGANLYFSNTETPNLQNCLIKQSGGDGIYLTGSTPQITNCNITNNAGSGIQCLYASPTIQDCLIQDNTNYGLYMYFGSSPFLSGNTYIGNGRGIGVYGSGGGTQSTFYNDGGEPYVILSDVELSSSGSLTVNPGVEIRFVSNTGINFSNGYSPGYLYAVGTPTDTILFTSESGLENDWDGIKFQSPSGADTNTIQYCIFEKGGQSGANLYFSNTEIPNLQNCLIKQSGGDGIYLTGSTPQITNCNITDNAGSGIQCLYASPTIQDCLIQDNTNYGLYMYFGSSPTLSNNTYSGNTYGIAIPASPSTGVSTFYNDGGEPYIILGDIHLVGGGTLNIQPGCEIRFLSNAGFRIVQQSTLNAIGTVDDSIKFTSESGLNNDWDGIYFAELTVVDTNSIQYCIFENAGQNGWGASANIYYTNGTLPYLKNCAIQQSGNNGISLSGSTPRIENCAITGNSVHGIHCSNSSPEIHLCSILNNGNNGIDCYNSNPSIDSCQFEDNGSNGLFCWYSEPDIQHSIFQNNTNCGVYIFGRYYPFLKNNQYDGNLFGIGLEKETYSGDTVTWYNDNGEPINVLGDIGVRYQSILTVEPGTTIKFADTAGIRIGDFYTENNQWGILNAIGTQDSLIIFTSIGDSSNGWDGMLFTEYSDDGPDTSFMRYCVVENAGQSGWGYSMNLYSASTHPHMRYCTINGSSGHGLYCNYASPYLDSCSILNNGINGAHCIYSSPTIHNSIIDSNTNCGVSMNGNSFPDLEGNVYSGNLYGIGVSGWAYTLDSGIWHNDNGEPMIILGDIAVKYQSMLTIEPGTIIKFTDTAGLRIGDNIGENNEWGILNAIGTPDSLITFTSLSGYSNGWDGIMFTSFCTGAPDISVMEYCIIEKAGQGGWGVSANLNLNASVPSMKRCIIRYSSDIGIYCNGNAAPIIGDSISNTCWLYDNSNYDMYNNTANTLFARYNYWGTSDLDSIDSHIYDSEDNPTKGSVVFFPYTVDHNVGIIDILEPINVVSIDSTLIPTVVILNDGLNEESGALTFKIGDIYSEVVDFSLEPYDQDTIIFPSWQPFEEAAYLITTTVELTTDQREFDDVLDAVISISDGIGPEIHTLLPSVGVAGSQVQIAIVGTQFETEMNATLMLSGESDIVADSITVNATFDTLTATFNLTGAVIDKWDLEISNSTQDTYHFYKGFNIILYGGDLLPFCSPLEFNVHDGTTIEIGGALIPKRSENLYMVLKKTNLTYHNTWAAEVRLLDASGSELISSSGGSDVAFQIEDPLSGLVRLLIDAYDPGTGEVIFCDQLPQLTLDEWYVGEVLRPWGFDWVQFDVPEGVATLYIQTEGMGDHNYFDVYLNHLNLPTQHWHFGGFNQGYHIEGQIQNPPAGRYYIKYMDSEHIAGDSSQERDYMLFVGADMIPPDTGLPLTITGLSTYLGGQGPVTVTVSGQGFDSTSTVFLIREGYTDIVASTVYRDSSGIELSAYFDLTSSEAGEWQLVVQNILNEADTAWQPFVIEVMDPPKLYLDIKGRDRIRKNRWQTYAITYSNPGNSDIADALLIIEIIGDFDYISDLPPALEFSDSTLFDTLLVQIPNIPAGTNTEFVLKLKTESKDRIGDLNIRLNHVIPETPVALPTNIELPQEPEDGDLVFRWFQPPWFSEWPAHVGIYREEGGIGYVIEMDSEGSINKTTWEDFQNAGEYIGHARPPCLESGSDLLGKNIADAAFNEFELEKEYDYSGLPICSGQKNCVSWTHEIYESQDCYFEYDPLIAPITLYNRFNGNQAKAWISEIPRLWGKTSPLFFAASLAYCLKERFSSEVIKNVDTVSSIDPEDKYGPNGFDIVGSPHDSLKRFVSNSRDSYSYRIDFWNHEDATADAQIVIIRDTLGTDFDISTFRFDEFGFLDKMVRLEGGQYFDLDVDMRPDKDLIVSVEGTFDPDHRAIEWTFTSLVPGTDTLPDLVGFLPPMSDSGLEIAWVDFSVDPLPDLPTGTQLTNQCYSNFDWQPPCDTCPLWTPAPKNGPWVNTIDADPPESEVLALPATMDSLYFTVNWAGSDGLGSGIKSYSIYYDIDSSGVYELWLEDTTATSAEFVFTEDGHTYSFYSIATDNVGFMESPPDSFDTRTTMSFPFVCGDVNCDTTVNIFDITYLITNLYLEGPDPCHPYLADVNGRDGNVNIFDITYIISYLYLEGSPPDCIGSDKTFASIKKTAKPDSALIVCSSKEGKSVIEINSPEEIFGVEMNLKSKVGSSVILESLIDGVKAYYSQDGDIITLGMVDAEGRKFIPKGKTEIIETNSEVEILSILAADKSSQPVPFKFNNIILPREFSLDQNYPNPFNPTTTIKFALPKSSYVELEIFNILGQRVTTLINDQLDAGYHTAKWNSTDSEGREVATGVYFYRLKAGDFVKSKKMLLLK